MSFLFMETRPFTHQFICFIFFSAYLIIKTDYFDIVEKVFVSVERVQTKMKLTLKEFGTYGPAIIMKYVVI